MSSPDLMAQASQAFSRWRKTRSHSGERTPPELRQLAVELLAHYSSGRICKRLGLSGSNLYRWARQVTPIAPSTDFVALPPSVAEPSLALKLDLGEGQLLTLQGTLTPAFVAQLSRELRR